MSDFIFHLLITNVALYIRSYVVVILAVSDWTNYVNVLRYGQ